ncbi:MAG: 23S rRNA (pseudouridine(1915)-N(3))-methyltransferase RlmH [Bacteroidota bacterium]
MKIACWYIGKTRENYLREGEAIYLKRLKHYWPVEAMEWPDIKGAGKMNPEQLKAKEAELILQKLSTQDGLIILDEGGKMMGSVEMASWLDKQLQQPYKRLVFLVGGAFGFDASIYSRANAKLSLSKLTFSHQMVRLFLLEQLYRSATILRNEPYHNV